MAAKGFTQEDLAFIAWVRANSTQWPVGDINRIPPADRALTTTPAERAVFLTLTKLWDGPNSRTHLLQRLQPTSPNFRKRVDAMLLRIGANHVLEISRLRGELQILAGKYRHLLGVKIGRVGEVAVRSDEVEYLGNRCQELEVEINQPQVVAACRARNARDAAAREAEHAFLAEVFASEKLPC